MSADFVPTRYGRRRDSQRQRVYAAEGRWWFQVNMDRIADDQQVHHLVEPVKLTSLDDCKRWLAEVTSQRWFQSRWGQVNVPMISGPGNNANHHRIMLTRSGWNRMTILHELSHFLTWHNDEIAGHGPEYAATMVTLVDGVFGKEVGRLLRESYDTPNEHGHRVKYRTGMKLVPKPGSARVVTKAEAAAKARTAKAREKVMAERRRASIISAERKAAASETIREMAKAGAFGPPGSPLRRRAFNFAALVKDS